MIQYYITIYIITKLCIKKVNELTFPIQIRILLVNNLLTIPLLIANNQTIAIVVGIHKIV